MKKRTATPPPTFGSLGEYLDHWTKQGKTQNDFAERFGISVGYLSDLKHGKVWPSLPLAKRFRDEIGIPVESFLETIS